MNGYLKKAENIIRTQISEDSLISILNSFDENGLTPLMLGKKKI